jgi:transcriptional regulator GlxA family with amidase domain
MPGFSGPRCAPADLPLLRYERAMPFGAVRIHVLALRDCTALVPVGIMDLLRKSAELSARRPGRSRDLLLKLVSAGRQRNLRGAGGLTLRCDSTLQDAGAADLVVIPALDPDIDRHLALNRGVVPWLRRAFETGAEVASACTGAFVVAEAGLLDGRAATTHWAFQTLLAERYPRVRIQPQAVLVDQGRIVTAGGATSFIQLALFLVERMLGPKVAWEASRMFLIDPNKAPQGAYAMFSSQKSHGDAGILRAQELIELDTARVPPIRTLARHAAMSQRTFVRRFLAATGNTPREYIQRVRIEAAKRLLESGQSSVGEVARRTGYGDLAAFRRLFVRGTGLTPSDYRARYGPHVGPSWVGRHGRAGAA